VGKRIKMIRKFIDIEDEEDMFLLHTRMIDVALQDNDPKATIAIVHGFGENADVFLELGL